MKYFMIKLIVKKDNWLLIRENNLDYFFLLLINLYVYSFKILIFNKIYIF